MTLIIYSMIQQKGVNIVHVTTVFRGAQITTEYGKFVSCTMQEKRDLLCFTAVFITLRRSIHFPVISLLVLWRLLLLVCYADTTDSAAAHAKYSYGWDSCCSLILARAAGFFHWHIYFSRQSIAFEICSDAQLRLKIRSVEEFPQGFLFSNRLKI
eukprot:IDg10376t1